MKPLGKARQFGLKVRVMGKCKLEDPPAHMEADLGKCWIWQGGHSGSGRGGGYPRMSLDGQTVAVHRVMAVCYHGYINSKTHVDHLCRNRLCCNPKHLEPTTHKENCRRRDNAPDQ